MTSDSKQASFRAAERIFARSGVPLFSALCWVSGLLASISAPSSGWSLSVTAPQDTVVAGGGDYATEVLADPWDFDGVGDIEKAELKDLTDPVFSDGVLRATTTGPDSNIWLIYQGVPSAFNLTRGALFPIDNSRYSLLSIKMRLSMSDGSTLPGANRRMNAFFYEDENAIPDGRFGFTGFVPFIDNQWHIIELDLSDPANINSNGFLWTDFPQIEGFRIDPSAGLEDVFVEIDWVRLSRPPAADTEVLISWSDAQNPVDIFAVDADGAAMVLGQNVGGSSIIASMAALAPGEYRIEIDDGVERRQSPGVVTVNDPPIVRFLEPDVRGDTAREYGQAANENGWAFLDSGDIDRVINVTDLSFSNPAGTLYGRPTSNDPSIVFFTPDAIDTQEFRALCYTLEVIGPRNIRDGSVARVFWGDSLNNLSTGEDVVVQAGVNEYCFDMNELPLEGSSNGDWQGIVQWFRLDPHEFPLTGSCPSSGSPEECRDFRLHRLTLAPFDAAMPDFTLEWSTPNSKPGSLLNLLLDPDRNPDNGNEVIIATDVDVQATGSLDFDFSTLGVGVGDYWILGIISDGININHQYSRGPLRLSGLLGDIVFTDGFESPSQPGARDD